MNIVQYLGGAAPWGDVNPDTMAEKGLGGRETALIQLALKWADMGFNVINFVPASAPYQYYPDGPGAAYFLSNSGVQAYIRDFGCDIAVSWEEPRMFSDQMMKNIGLAIIEMQVAHLETTPEYDANTNYYAVLSKWAGDFLLEQSGGEIDHRKLAVHSNGVDLGRYLKWEPAYPSERAESGSFHFYYSSSPDRGLADLLKAWPRIREMYPRATLHVAYGLDGWINTNKWHHYMQSEMALSLAEDISQDGIEYHGKIGQDDLAALQQDCDALLYPCNPMSPTETGCITVVEAGAAGCPAIITDADCLGSEFKRSAAICPLPFDVDRYCDTISNVMDNESLYVDLQRRGFKLAQSRDWAVIAEGWCDMFAQKGEFASVN